MKIDSHQHFWKYNPVRDSWIDDSMKILRKDFLPVDLEPILRKNKVDGCMAIQADQSEDETSFLLKLADEHDFIKGVIGWVDLKNPNLESRLVHFCKNKKFKGVRHVLQAESKEYVLSKEFQTGISKLNKFGLVYELLIYPFQLKNSIDLAHTFSDQIFILDHMAKPNIKEQKIINWQKDISNLAKAENVFCKISGMVTEADWANWKPSDFEPYLDVIFESFGVDRILFGSDWPVCLLAAKYEETLEILNGYLSHFSKKDKNKILYKNAVNAYQLES